jgi:hypothetical protein
MSVHEISIIESILEVAEQKARDANSPSITVIKLRLGEFTSIRNHWSHITAGYGRIAHFDSTGSPGDGPRLRVKSRCPELIETHPRT